MFSCFDHLSSFSRYEAAFLRVLCFVAASSLRDEVTLPGRVCLSPRSERRLFLHLPGVWLESSRWGHPDGSSLSQISIGTKTLHAPSLGVGAEPSRWGHPYWVVWRISAYSIGTKASSIHLSLVASRWGHPTGRVWFFSHSIETKSSLDIWSVFLQDGVTLFGSESNDLIFSEGMTTVGLLGEFFRPVLGVSFCHPLVGRSALKRGGFHIQLSSLLARTLCIPLANEGVGLGPSSSGPVTSRPPLAFRSASAASRRFFSPGHFMRRSSTHGGSLAALPEVGLLGMGCWRKIRVPQILCLTPLPGVRSRLLFLA